MRYKKRIPATLAAAGAYLYAISPRLSHRPERMPRVYYAHRGLHDNLSNAPENTLAAFQKAVEGGYGIELDVQLTRDGRVVVVHDYNLKRICRVDREVDSLTWEELQQYTVYQSDQHIPLLSEVLKLVDGRVPLIVELKVKNAQSRICERTQEILNHYEGTYCIESFHPRALVWYRNHYPSICRGQLSMNFQREDKNRQPVFYVMRHLLVNFLTRPDFIAYDCRAMRAFSKNLCRSLYGCPAVAWTVKCQAQLDACRPFYDYFIFEGFVPKD